MSDDAQAVSRLSQFVSGPITLSHSQLEDWHKCRAYWSKSKIYRAPRAPSEHLILGSAVHAAIEARNRRYITVDQSQMSADEMDQVFLLALEYERSHQDPRDLLASRIDLARRRGRAMVRALANYGQAIAPTGAELEFQHVIDDRVKFTGRIDATIAGGIIDYKTASSAESWSSNAADSKDQATAYSMAFPSAQHVTFVVLVAPPMAPDVAQILTRRTSRTITDVQRYERLVVAAADQIRESCSTNTFPTSTSALCAYCGFLGQCTDGQAYLKRTRRLPAVPIVS